MAAGQTFRPKSVPGSLAPLRHAPHGTTGCALAAAEERAVWAKRQHFPGAAERAGWTLGMEVAMTQLRRLDVEAVLHEAYPLFSFSCCREAGGRYSISLGSQPAAMPRTTVVGIHGDELSSAGRVRSLGLELINSFIDS